MCTPLMVGAARAIALTTRSPIARFVDFKKDRGWRDLPVYSGDYTHTYVSPEDGDVSALNAFTRHHGAIYRFWACEMNNEMTDLDQDGRGAPDADPLWTILDMTPEGRGGDWYPKLDYPQRTSRFQVAFGGTNSAVFSQCR